MDEVEQLRKENADLRRAVYRYRWDKLADGLVICVRRLDRRFDDRSGNIREQVVHRTGCPKTPRTDYLRADSTVWFVNRATGYSLARAVAEDKARLCGSCRPDVDVDNMID